MLGIVQSAAIAFQHTDDSLFDQASHSMQLYDYEHCPFCAKVRLLAGLKSIPLLLQVVSADDVDSCVSLVGRKVVPVLIKADGSAMAESMEIVRHLDALDSQPLLTGRVDPAIGEWIVSLGSFLKRLTYPRFARYPFAELATA
jgi:glutaredoxin 2